MLAALLIFAAAPQLNWEERQPTRLLPEASEYDSRWDIKDYARDYRRKLRVVFRDVYGDGIFARMQVEPSFEVEYAVAIRSDRDHKNYSLFTLTPASKVWYYVVLEDDRAKLAKRPPEAEAQRLKEEIATLEADAPGRIEDLGVKRCDRNISSELGEALFSLWAQALYDVRYHKVEEPTPGGPYEIRFGADGVTYHFGFEYGGTLAGYVWSPDEESNLGRFVRVGDQLRDLCEKPESVSEPEIAHAARELLNDIKNTP